MTNSSMIRNNNVDSGWTKQLKNQDPSSKHFKF